MPRRKSAFGMSDVTRAIKASRAAGVEVARVEIDKAGNIVIVTGNAAGTAEPVSDFDKWKSRHAR